MDRINDTLFAHWHTDSNGNPQSIAITETQQVSPIHYCIQLNQIPDDTQLIEVKIGSTVLSEVYDSQTIGQNNYKVDFSDGIIWFNKGRAGATVTISYSGIGYKVISAKRVMINDGDYIEENTLQKLIDLNAEAVATINNIQKNLDNILASANAYADQTKLEIDQYSSDTKNKMSQAYTKLYAQMDSYVGEILKYKTQAISEMTVTLNQYRQEADKANEEMNKAIIDFSAVAEANIAKLDKALNNAMAEIQKLIATVQEASNNIIKSLQNYEKEEKAKMDGIVDGLSTHSIFAKQQIQEMIDGLQTYINNRKATLDAIVEEAREIQSDLQHIFNVQLLIWEGEFNDSQLDRMNQFVESQKTKNNEFNIAQTNRANDFTKTKEEQQKAFNQAETEREKVFDAMKQLAYDENAVLANTALSNTKIDTVEMEERVLELVRDPETGKITGSIGGDRIHFYSNVVKEDGTTAKEKIAEHLVVGRQSTYKGTEEPIDVEKIWYDISDEDCKNLQLPSDYNLGQFQDAVNQIRDEVSTIQASVKMEDINPGTFYGDNSNSQEVDENSSNIKYVRIKTGSNLNLRPLKEGEMAYCPDTGRLYIGVRQSAVSTLVQNQVIGGTSSGGGESGGGNLTGEHLELDGRDGKKYRIYIDEDGELKQRLVEFLDAEAPKPETAGVGARFSGLMINRYFGGGTKDNGKAPISHSFIELYNNNASGQTMNLKGLCLYYKTLDDGVWRRFELKGYVPYQHSFLVRCGRVNSKANSSCRYEIKKFDQSWDIELSYTSGMVYLGVDYGQLTISNPYNLADGTTLNSYIDTIAGACETEERSLTALEYDKKKAPAYRRLLSQDCGIQRIDFGDTGSTYKDIEQVNYRTCDMAIYRPRCVEDGAWDLYYNKTKLNENIPNLLNIQYGKEWHTRTFTWQSKVMSRGYLRYRKAGENKWIYKNTNTEIVYHIDQDCTIHRVIVRNLEEGIYEYQAGDEGCWGDVSTFEVKSYQKNGTYDKTQHLKFLHVSDQQALYENDYEAWRWTAQYIEDNENPNDYDFVINTGDISQSGNRSFEWRCYYKFPRFLKEKCHMLTCGNNDLFEKIYSNCFKYYDATENDFLGDTYVPNIGNHDVIQGVSPYGGYASAHSYDLGYCHFVCVNSNMIASVEDPDIWVKQMNWVRQDVQAARMRPNPPRWFIMIAHHGAFTVCRMKDVQQMIPFVEDIGFHVVICGHHHTYSRSTPIRMDIRKQVEAKTGHDLYEVYSGCGQNIAKAVYGIGYLETFANNAGVHVVPKDATYDQTTENGTLEDGTVSVVSNGNVGSRQKYVNDSIGCVWVMAQAGGAKLKSNKDMEKTPTPWYYGWCNYSDELGYTNNPHPYKPNYLMWDISWDKISVKSYVLNGIVDFDSYLADAVMKRPDQINYADVNKEMIDEFEIKWRNIPQTAISSVSEVSEDEEEE